MVNPFGVLLIVVMFVAAMVFRLWRARSNRDR